jgi:hypothetical protein
MTHFVKIVNGLVKEFWDSPPPVPVGTDGWKNANFIDQSIDTNKQYYGNILFDLEPDPVLVSHEIKTYTVEERKQNLLNKNSTEFDKIIETAKNVPNMFTAEELQSYRTKASDNKTKIENCNSHNDIDNLTLDNITVF